MEDHDDVDTTDMLINDYRPASKKWGIRARLPSCQIVFRVTTFLLIFLTFVFAVLIYFKETKMHENTETTSPQFFPTAYQQMAKTAVNMMDLNSNPCNDFYQYVCGGYTSSHSLAPNQNMYIPSFQIIDQQNTEIIENLVSEQWPLISDLFQSCTQNPQAIETDTIETLTPYINSINNLQSAQDAQLLPLLAQLHVIGIDAFFVPGYIDNIFENTPNRLNHLILEEGGLSEYINYNDTTDLEELAQAVGYTLQLFNPNLTNSELTSATIEVIDFEVQIAMIHSDPEDFSDYLVNMTYAQFKQFFTNFDFDYYIQGIGLGNVITPSTTVIAAVPYFFNNLQNVIQKNPLSTIQYYLQWRLLYSLLDFDVLPVQNLYTKSPDFAKSTLSQLTKISQSVSTSILPQYEKVVHITPAKNNFKKNRSNTYVPSDDQIATCTDLVNELLGDFVGLLFSEKIVDNNVVWSIANMTQHINTAFQDGLSDLTWIDTISKNLAQYKLQNIIQIIGHPNLLDRYHGVVLSQSYSTNVISLLECKVKDALALVETPFIRADYEFPATIVNAFYSPLTNTINFPAGILESPMFSTSLPAIFGYARMGYVVGHETTHSLDNNGRLWNSWGVYGDWMTNQSSHNFNTQAQCVVNQYDNFYVNYQGSQVHINGEQTLGENIADLGGAKNAYKAYKAWEVQNNGPEFPDKSLIPFLTNDQLFWVLLGQTWCTLANEQGLVKQIVRDVHSPSKFRVNGPLSNIPQFASAFQCPANSPMNPNKKFLVW
eukprot:TRINITY_DN5357_c0_g2_i1.p1 TRINITY_DN5357_c0_g2~~TRINITY_DN5357_c0_g2_i1.p1  ORF type:complete len:769 (-),score=136.58 TRINITY_DN5357_c0_g2_i1:65-2371(-)